MKPDVIEWTIYCILLEMLELARKKPDTEYISIKFKKVNERLTLRHSGWKKNGRMNKLLYRRAGTKVFEIPEDMRFADFRNYLLCRLDQLLLAHRWRETPKSLAEAPTFERW